MILEGELVRLFIITADCCDKENDVLPLKDLIDTQANVYEMTCVAIEEANIYAAVDKGREIEASGEKIVSVVLDRALNNEIEYQEPNEDKA